ncbi:RICIN domain-containing protein [Aquimarina sp. RZ0]|uniref:RICIN domain-containing protein n=1 Tax=Aquimarina sp. RZ0 TaxID=2607730 RepID=UPI0011F38289|nr:RICIN domain-containing protein [Aquimarina sp. RZ0]KAA1244055.1 T9SS type A sorting domain-containing protein [Aquimarina sp. RZ0]
MKFFKNRIHLFFITFLFFCTTVDAKNIYVSKNGKDSNSGSETSPYKTIKKASSVARAGDIVIIGAGTYEELLEPARSGTPGNPIVYRAKTGEKVIITAMQAVNNWTVDQGNIYKATVNWDLGQDNMALHNDNLMDLARWPNNVPQNLFERDYLPACNRGAAGGGKTWMNYNGSQSNGHAKKIPYANKWKNGGSIHFYGGAGFLAWTDFITNSSPNRIDFKLQRAQNWIQLRHHPGYTGHGVKKGEFFLQGIKEALDYKNEWFYDKNNKTLYVQIDGGGAPATNSIRFRRRTQTIKLNKNYIHIENLAVFGGSIDISGNNNKLSRVSSFYGNHTLGVINGFDSRRQSVLITGNKNTIERCEIAWGAGNGVYDKGDDNKLLNSYVHDFNYLGNYDCVLNTRGAKRGSYRNNTLTRSGKDIIQAYVDGGEFAYNDISLNNFVADDGGLLYTTNARATKSSIHHNTFHDSQARNGRFKGTGIYLDNDSKNWDVYNNVVWNTKWTNIQINWNGTNLKIYNNTFAKGSATMGAWHKAGTRFSNVQVWNNITDKEAVDQQGNQESESTWEPQSNKQNNLVSKASFVNWNKNDYQLKSGARAINYGRVIAGYTDGYKGSKPDAGAYEFGAPKFKTGVNWPITSGPSGTCYGLPGENCNGTTNPPTGENDEVAFRNAPSSINPKISYTFQVAYEASINREIVVEFWSSTGWLSSKKETVSAGSGIKSITVTLPSVPELGTGYVLKTHIRPVGGTWNDALNRDQVNDITIEAQSTQLIADGIYNIKSTTVNQNLLSLAGETHNARMSDPTTNSNQDWIFTHLNDDIYTIKNKKTNRFLEVPYAKCKNGENVTTWTSATSDHQKWKIVSNGNNIYGFKPLHCQEQALDRTEGKNNANVITWTFNKNNANQKWKVIPTGNRAFEDGITEESIVKVYPNPAENIITVEGLSSGDYLLVYDLLGKVIHNNVVDETREVLDISNLESGLYIISVPGKEKIRFVKN